MASTSRLLLAACAVCLALASAAPARNTSDCVSSSLIEISGINVYPASHQIFSPTTLYAQDRTTVQIADNFEVTYYNTYKVVTARTNMDQSETYVLYQCGTVRPSLASLGLPDGTKTFEVPLISVSVEDTTVLSFMKLLGVLDRVSYVNEFAIDPCMQFLAGSVCKRTDTNADPSLIDAKFLFYVNASDVQAVICQATADPGPLNRAEYIKFIATFFNKEAIANTIFADISVKYDETKRSAEANLAKSNGTRPVVAWLDFMKGEKEARDAVYLRFAKYRRDYTEDAGGKLLDRAGLAKYANGVSINATKDDLVFITSDLSNVTLPVLRTILKDVDVVIDESYYEDPTKATLKSFRSMYGLDDEAAMTEMKFLVKGKLLRLDGQAQEKGSTSWYEQAVARPDLVLGDLVAGLQEGLLTGDTGNLTGNGLVRSLFAPSPKPVMLSTANCPSAQKRCQTTAQPICPAVFLDCKRKVVSATSQQPCAPDCSLRGTGVGDGSNAAPRAAVITPVALLVLLVTALAAVAMSR